MSRFWSFLADRRTLAVIGFIALAALIFGSASLFKMAAVWGLALLGLAALVWLAVWAWQRRKARLASEQLTGALEQQGQKAAAKADPARRPEVEALRSRLNEAVHVIKTSKLGQTTGSAALYELPWYMVIGNPAAGKSTVVVNAGLKFPFADKAGVAVQGVGGTRNCDWFFTTQGIILDTAGRYTLYAEDRAEWLSFLDLLKKNRPKAPINGILIAASIPDLTGAKPESVINLAKNLRMRVQELTEKLEVFAPVYVLFTKSDLIPGFNEFFAHADLADRERVWGASLPYDPEKKHDPLKAFDEKFEELYEGLKEKSLAEMGLSRAQRLPTGLLSFPLEFAGLKPSLAAFIATLFEENPYQFQPVFRGFYFTSAVQEGQVLKASSDRIAQRFSLPTGSGEAAPATIGPRGGYFLADLFKKVVFPDQNLVKQYASPAKQKLRLASFFGVAAVLGLALAGWSWSLVGNRQLASNVQADLAKAVKLQEGRFDLQSRLEAMEILQDRIEQLERYERDRPLSLSLGLYQGDALLKKLRTEYFHGIGEILLKPVGQTIEAYLGEVNSNAAKLAPQTGVAANTGSKAGATYRDASPTSTEDAYNALKTYLMLASRERAEPGHLSDQITRFWRSWLEANRGNMPREQMIRTAERIISFYSAQVSDPAWPTLTPQLALIDATRDSLVRVVSGTPARERVYAQIRARASVQYPPMTVARLLSEQDAALVGGSYSVSGAFTREAWEGFVKAAIKDASVKELQTKDWVLNVAARDDLTLEGSPEQIEKALVKLYKTEYAIEWRKFVEGITVAEFKDFPQAVATMNRLGDQRDSPILKLMETLYAQTSWDNPSLVNEGLAKARRGVVQWFKETILRRTPGGVAVDLKVSGREGGIPLGPVGAEFEAVADMMVSKDGTSFLKQYLTALGAIRQRFNKIKNEGDPGPGARALMVQTLEGSGSELATAQQLVEGQVNVNRAPRLDSAGSPMPVKGQEYIRAILLRPLMQGFAVIARPTETELNRTWTAQVYEPFQRQLAGKYPFDANSRIEAGPGEIAQVFGPEGAVAKFVNTAMGPLVVRRGDLVTPRTWADIGLSLSPEFTASLPRWIAPLDGSGAAGGASGPTTVFQLQPLPAAGLTEYTVEIDGQVLRYRNTPPQWANFVWPNAAGTPGAKVTAIAFDGRSIELVNEPGRLGLERIVKAAERRRLPDNLTELTWTSQGTKVSVNLRVISNTQAGGGTGGGTPQQGLQGVKLPAAVAGAAFAASGAPAPAATSPATATPGAVSTSNPAAGLTGSTAVAPAGAVP